MYQGIKRFAKSLFGNEVTDVDRILESLTAAQATLNLQITRLNEMRDVDMSRKIRQMHAEARTIRKNQHNHQYQILHHISQVNETHNKYASLFEVQNARIESLDA